jgi:hypothetical protein
MTDDPDDPDDPLARTVLDGTAFHRQRLAVGITNLSQQRKLAAFALTAGVLSLLLPIGLTLPRAVRDGFLGGAPLSASPAILVVAVFGLAAELAAGVAVAFVAVRARDATLTEREALHLVAVDNVATMVGLGVGAFAVAAALCGFGVGYAGVEGVRAFASPANGVAGPYTTLAWAPTVGTVGAVAVGVAVVLGLFGVAVGAE